MNEERSIRILMKPVEELIPYINNPRIIGEDAINAVASSIKNFGFKVPIVIDSGNEIITGHTRLLAAKKINLPKVPCILADDLTQAEVKAYRIADNRTGEYAEWDDEVLSIEMEMLQEEFEELEQIAEMTGFSEEEISSLMDAFSEEIDCDHLDEDEIELPSDDEVITVPGDRWQLGPHYLMCGDTTNASNIDTLMAGEAARMIFTDPPYNVDYVGKTKDALQIENDHMEDSSFRKFLRTSFENMLSVTDYGAGIYICHADSEGINFRKAMVEAGWLMKQTIIWVKDSFVMGRQDYHWQHEPILYGWKPGEAHRYYGGRKQSTIWEIKRPKRNDIHPTMKPVELAVKAIKNSSLVGEIILDGFGGGGTTLISADYTDRIAYLMEFDPKYCDAILIRYIKYCKQEGKPIELYRNGEEFDSNEFNIE